MSADDGEPERRRRTRPLRARRRTRGAHERTLDDPALLRRWADDGHLERFHPRRNWPPMVAGILAVVLVGLVAVTVGAFRPGEGRGRAVDGGDRGEVRTSSLLDDGAPSLDDLTSEVTVPPRPESGLSVVDSGVTVVADRFDPDRREGTYAVIVVNPNLDWSAHGVQLDVSFLDEAGTAVGTEREYLDVVLPGQKVAVAAVIFDAPVAFVTDVEVTLDVARWLETRPVEGELQTRDAVTEAAEFSGARTRFVLRSSFARSLTDVRVTAVYRNGFGGIIGGSDVLVDLLEPDVDTPLEISLPAGVTFEQIAGTELYPSADFGTVPGED